MFVWGVRTTEYRLSKLKMGTYIRNQSIFCVVYSQNCIFPPTTDVYIEAQFAVLPCFCDCVYFIHFVQ